MRLIAVSLFWLAAIVVYHARPDYVDYVGVEYAAVTGLRYAVLFPLPILLVGLGWEAWNWRSVEPIDYAALLGVSAAGSSKKEGTG